MSEPYLVAGRVALNRLLSKFDAHINDDSGTIAAVLQTEFANIRLGWKESFSKPATDAMIDILIAGLKNREDQLSGEAADAQQRGENFFIIVGKSGDLMSFRNSLEKLVAT